MTEVNLDWEAIACASGYRIDEIPSELREIFEGLHQLVKDANAMSFGDREEFGLRSTQVIGLVVLLWRAGLFKEQRP